MKTEDAELLFEIVGSVSPGTAAKTAERKILAVRTWRCVCGRRHEPWWRTTTAPTCTRNKGS